MPKVSIIIPTYNGERFIHRAIKSTQNQTLRDIEIIIVDDVSKDNTRARVEEIAKQDSRIISIALSENSGGGPAVPRTVGCKAAKGDFIAFLDQDDLYMPEYLEKMVDRFDRHPEINATSGFAWAFDEKKKKIMDYGMFGPFNTVLRKGVLDAVGYYKASQNNVDDAGMWIRYDKIYGPHMHLIIEDGPLTLYSKHAGQGSDSTHKDPQIFIKRIDSIFADIDSESDPAIRNYVSHLYARKANFYCLAGDFRTGRHFFSQSLKQRFNFFSLVLLAASFLPMFYGTIVSCFRFLQSKIIARVRVLVKRTRYEESYQSAKKVLASPLS